MLIQYFKLGHGRFFPYPFQFIIDKLPHHLTQKVWFIDSAIKYTINK
jgi:hypothetical protein